MFKFIASLLLLTSFPVAAGLVDDLIVLSRAGISEEVLMAWVDRHSESLNANDIIALKNANVPDKVVVSILRQATPAVQAQVAQAAPTEHQPVVIEEKKPE